MKKTLLITFGCSWVAGVGVNWEHGMSEDDFNANVKNKDICNEYSFRGLISKNLKIDHLNFGEGASSNQRQFRLAKTFFFSQKFKNIKKNYNNIIVLWGITSTARYELYSTQSMKHNNFMYNTAPQYDYLTNSLEKNEYNKIKGADWPSWEDYANLKWSNIDIEILKDIVTTEKLYARNKLDFLKFENLFPFVFGKFSWDVDASTYEIILEIKMLSNFFENNDINFLWFDTFNHHDYKKSFTKFVDPDSEYFELKNFLEYKSKSRDLLSLILKNNNSFVKDLRYHLSSWTEDNKKISVGVKKKLLNPFTFHPTKYGHDEIAKILQPEIERFL